MCAETNVREVGYKYLIQYCLTCITFPKLKLLKV